jgi:putative phosphoribosyl transferase
MQTPTAQTIEEQWVDVSAGSVTLFGKLTMPLEASGVILFAHGSGSGLRSPRNRYVARLLNESKLATLLIDLLTQEEQEIDLRTKWLRSISSFSPKGSRAPPTGSRLSRDKEPPDRLLRSQHWRCGQFGGGGRSNRPGRCDRLAGSMALTRVRAPTLLIVGGNDFGVIELNREALKQLTCEKRLALVPGATHLFVEPGTLDEVAHLARQWFHNHLIA